ncbi:G-protein coupled receptor Mth2-like [Anticarsia gemmatalis]|uniref:G-protein coupled receptor Mth2-like n=1 Tax=Anticarsia gemmatalis TaxID=129554 RepID=UPI003F760D4A
MLFETRRTTLRPVHLASNNTCCPTGKVLLMRKDICWDPISNGTSPIFLKCSNTFRFRQHFTVTEEQELHLKIGNEFDEKFSLNSYCVDNTTTIKDVSLKNVTLSAIVCADEDEQILDDRVLGYCMIASIIFLAPTALIYSAIPELRDVQGKSIINFCISLAIGQGILSIMKLMEYTDMALCATRGFLAYFFLIAAFFWTNAISIQVLLNTRRPATLDYSWYEFKWYFLYAWGCPSVLTICMAIVNFHPGDHSKPGIGLNHCWFFNKTQQWYYMFSIMSILLAANIAIFIYTSIMLWRLSFSSSHLKAMKFKFVMSVRLIILMGLPWVFEMVGSLAGQHIVWSIIDVFNCLQGVLIFMLLVVFRRRVIKLMYNHGWLDCMSGFVEKYLAVEDDEENVVQHTDVPMTMGDRTIT